MLYWLPMRGPSALRHMVLYSRFPPLRRTRGAGDRFGIPKPSPMAEARPTGRAVSGERLGDWDGQMVGGLSPIVSTKACHMAKRRVVV